MAADRRMIITRENMRTIPMREEPGGFRIRLDQVSKNYGPHAVVEDISLEIQSGECLALLGPNGAGKTTLFKLMLGLIRPGSGSVEVNDQDPSARDFRPHRAQIGFLPENISFHDAMTGAEVLTFYARLKSVPPGDCVMLLDRVGLTEAASRRVKTYSKGMRQRLGLAQALLGHPRLLILDEPTSGLDPALRRQFFDILRSFREAGVTTVISSHALTEIEAHADRYAILQNNSIVALGTLSALQGEAGLPVHISLTLPRNQVQPLMRHFGESYGARPAGARRVDLICAEDQKMPLIKKIMTSKFLIEDIEVHSSRLEDIYAHFISEEVRK